jgi:hypothetical protein
VTEDVQSDADDENGDEDDDVLPIPPSMTGDNENEREALIGNVIDDEGDLEVFHDSEDSDYEDVSDESVDEDERDANSSVNSKRQPADEICNGVTWSRKPMHNVRLSRNIVNERPRCLTSETEELKIFDLLFPEEIRRIILRCTNRKASALRLADPKKCKACRYSDFTYDELNAFFGFIIRAGADRDNMCALEDFYKENDSKPFYRACMSLNRIKFLLQCLRFDNIYTREQRKEGDKMAAISEVWSMFCAQLRRYYVPDVNITIDEQLVGYRGCIPGRTYMPSKPRKYGLKIFWACESGTGYALNARIYCGRSGVHPDKGLAETITMELCKPFYGSGRNITTDNFFTSHSLAVSLLGVKLTLLGTIRHHRREVPKSLHKHRHREVQSTEFRFDNTNKFTIASYVPKRNRCVLLLSSMHYGGEIEGPQQKPVLIHDYNKTKGGVDQMDENIEEYTVRRKSNRWPVVIFYNMVDVACFNSYIISRANGNRSSRKQFLKTLSLELAYPYMMQKIRQPSLKNDTRACMRIFLSLPVCEKIERVLHRPGDTSCNPRRCVICKKSSRDSCFECSAVVCAEHKVVVKMVKCVRCSSSADNV